MTTLKKRGVTGGVLVCVCAVTATLSASSGQSESGHVNRPQAAGTPARVIQTLPPVTFGSPVKARPTFASAAGFRRDATRPAARPGTHPPASSRVICGLTTIEQSPDLDAQMVKSGRDTGSAVRRIVPQTCDAAR